MDAQQADWMTLRRAAGDGVAVIPMGSFEAHGPHMPCGTDTMLVEGIVSAAVEASDPRRVVVFPTVRYSVVEWARPFASVGLSPATLHAKLVDLAADLHRLGFRRIAFVQGHGNLPASQMAISQLRYDKTLALYVDLCPYLMAADEARDIAGEDLTHAGTIETALMLALHADRVDMARAVDGPGDLGGGGFGYRTLHNRPGVFCIPASTALPDGVEGLATRATAEMGARLLRVYADALAEVFDDILGTDVPSVFLEDVRKEPDP